MNQCDQIEIIRKIKIRVNECVEIANKKLSKKYKIPTVYFNLRGTCAGIADSGKYTINFNLPMASENLNEFLYQTVPHEVSHLLSVLYFECYSGHNPEWKWFMRNVYELEPKRCHNFDVKKHRIRKIKVHLYCCAGCGKIIRVGSKKHNITQAISLPRYGCSLCGTPIKKTNYQKTVDKYD